MIRDTHIYISWHTQAALRAIKKLGEYECIEDIAELAIHEWINKNYPDIPDKLTEYDKKKKKLYEDIFS